MLRHWRWFGGVGQPLTCRDGSHLSLVRGADPAGVDASKAGYIPMLAQGNGQVTLAPLLGAVPENDTPSLT